MMKLDWKIYSIAVGILVLAVMVLFLKKFFFFLVISSATALLAVVLRFLHPAKYLGIELVTLSTIFVGIVYGPVIGGVYAFVMLLVHLVLGDYYIGTYLVWLLPEYILLGVLAGIFGTGMIGSLGVAFIVGMNTMNLIFTFIGENERVVKELPFAIGNSLINSVILVRFFSSIVGFID